MTAEHGDIFQASQVRSLNMNETDRLRSTSRDNVSRTSPPKHPQMSQLETRVATFNGRKVAPGQDAKTLASAGFFYVGMWPFLH